MPRNLQADVEMAILEGYRSGLTQRQIGRPFGIGPAAVAKHATKIQARYGAADRAHLVAIAYDLGLLLPRRGAK